MESLKQNAKEIAELCHHRDVRFVAVTKVTRGDPEIAKVCLEAGADAIGDSRLDNLRRMKSAGIKGPFMLIRIPMPSEVEEAVALSDVILVSEPITVELISKAAQRIGKNQAVLYMVDVGDLREGVWYPNAVDEITKALKMPNVHLYGIGTNLGCYGGVIPDTERMNVLASVAEELEKRGLKVPILSGGNTAAIKLIENDTLPNKINEYRIGEAVILGTDITNGRKFEYLNQDTFTLYAEVVELKLKPSVPVGKIGRDSMGRIPHFEDLGTRKKAILAIGEQDVALDGLTPLERGVVPLHASSDHAVLDVTDAKKDIRVGDKMAFRLSYGALLRAMTSPYVKKIHIRK